MARGTSTEGGYLILVDVCAALVDERESVPGAVKVADRESDVVPEGGVILTTSNDQPDGIEQGEDGLELAGRNSHGLRDSVPGILVGSWAGGWARVECVLPRRQ